MDPALQNTAERPKYEDLAGVIELSLLAPELSESAVADGCEQARRLDLAAVLVRPSDVDLVVRWLGGSRVALAAALDTPHGSSTTTAKVYAARDLLRRGAKEIDTVFNLGKLISRQFQYLETELLQIADACHASGAICKVTLDTAYLDEELKIVACRIAKRAGADFMAAPTLPDVLLVKNYSRDRLRLKAAGEVVSLESALEFQQAGCSRMQTTQPGPMLDAWKARLAKLETSGLEAQLHDQALL